MGIDTTMIVHMKALEADNARLKDVHLADVRWPKRQLGIKSSPIRFALAIFSVSEACYRNEAKSDAENKLVTNWLIRLTENNCSQGFVLCY